MGRCNGGMKAKELREHCEMKDLLKAAIAQFNLSGRGYDRTLKVPRTIADLEGAPSIEIHHVVERVTTGLLIGNCSDDRREVKEETNSYMGRR